MPLLVLTAIVLFLSALIVSARWLHDYGFRAQNVLVAFTGTQDIWEDERHEPGDKFDAISTALVEQAHLWARRGLRIAEELRASGAVTEGAYHQACAAFAACAAEKERWHVVPERLPWIPIRGDDERRRAARRAWQQLESDRRILHRHTTYTFRYAYHLPAWF